MKSLLQNSTRFMLDELAAGLNHQAGKERLYAGVLWIKNLTPTSFDMPTFNKIIIPIFTRTVYEQKHLDVNVLEYVEVLFHYIQRSDVIHDSRILDIPAWNRKDEVDEEADALNKLADMFIAYYDEKLTSNT